MVKHAGRAMVDQGRGGAIVLTASVAGLNSGAGPAAYSASKAGVINLAKTAAQQMTTANVRVNAICPGLTETGMTRPTFDYAKEKGRDAQDRPAQSAEARGAARGACQCRAVPRERSGELCQRSGDRGRRRPYQLAPGDAPAARPDVALGDGDFRHRATLR